MAAAGGGGLNNMYAPPPHETLPPTSTYRKFREKIIDPDMLVRAQEIYHRSGPICATEGFYQHAGECWNDAAQTIFCYSTGVNRIVQEALLFKTTEEIVSRTSAEKRHLFSIYIDAMRNRFVRSVLNEHERIETCSSVNIDDLRLRQLQYGKHRAQGLNSFAAALFGKGGMNGVPNAFKLFGKGSMNRIPNTGKSIYELNYIRDIITKGDFLHAIIPHLITLFNLDSTIDLTTTFVFNQNKNLNLILKVLFNVRTVGFTIALEITSRIFGKRTPHAVTMYTCNQVDYYYDDNYGVFKFPWRKLFIELSNTKGLELIAVDFDFTQSVSTIYLPGLYQKGTGIFITYNPFTGKRIEFNSSEQSGSSEWWSIDRNTKIGKIVSGDISIFNILSLKPDVPLPANVKQVPRILGRGTMIHVTHVSDAENSGEGGAAAGGVPVAPEKGSNSNTSSIDSRLTAPEGNMNSYIRYEEKYGKRQANIKKAMGLSEPTDAKYNHLRRKSQRIQKRRTAVRKNIAGALGITTKNLETERKSRMKTRKNTG